MWKENYMNGQGEYKWKDGRRYKGEYESDQKHGIGTYFFGDGRYYSGHWEHGKQHGEGIYFDEGVIRKGIWKEGERVMWTEE